VAWPPLRFIRWLVHDNSKEPDGSVPAVTIKESVWNPHSVEAFYGHCSESGVGFKGRGSNRVSCGALQEQKNMRKSGGEEGASARIPDLERLQAFLLKLRMSIGVTLSTSSRVVEKSLLEKSLPSSEKRPCKSTDQSVSETSHDWSYTIFLGRTAPLPCTTPHTHATTTE
jgi:hypothetical protein